MWIEPRSSIASANVSIRVCGTSIHDDGPSSSPGRRAATLTARVLGCDVPGWQRRRTHGQSPHVLRSAPTSGASSFCLEHAADDPLELLRDVGRQLATL